MTSQFVILHHRQTGGDHWDLMLEHGDSLATWQLMSSPAGPQSLPIAARRIGNHRKAYLAYEGPLSGGRGDVRRVDHGPVEIAKLTDEECLFAAAGKLLHGSFMLRRLPSQEWQLTPAPARAPTR